MLEFYLAGPKSNNRNEKSAMYTMISRDGGAPSAAKEIWWSDGQPSVQSPRGMCAKKPSSKS